MFFDYSQGPTFKLIFLGGGVNLEAIRPASKIELEPNAGPFKHISLQTQQSLSEEHAQLVLEVGHGASPGIHTFQSRTCLVIEDAARHSLQIFGGKVHDRAHGLIVIRCLGRIIGTEVAIQPGDKVESHTSAVLVSETLSRR